MAKTTSLNVNGRKQPVNVDSQTRFLTVLRDLLNSPGRSTAAAKRNAARVRCSSME